MQIIRQPLTIPMAEGRRLLGEEIQASKSGGTCAYCVQRFQMLKRIETGCRSLANFDNMG
ncbi:MAG TPA: hypothetical protein VFJ58_11980 [Armatimonadota bacterium]|nr:hypothetical protein [Armatimonadota bacterium]